MIKIKQLTKQEYENIANKPSDIVLLYKTETIEKQLIKVLSCYFAENIKEMREYLKTVSKFDFTNSEYVIFKTDNKSVTAFFPEIIND